MSPDQDLKGVEAVRARPDGAEAMDAARPGETRVRRALLSVSDKRGLVEFASALEQLGVELVSTGGTAQALAGAGISTRPIEDYTGFPEILDGRVKTLNPLLYAALLARRDQETHLSAAREHGIEPVDLVCVNLYPFEETVRRTDASEAEAIENIDVGGPTMIRAAAKNNAFVAVVVDPADYPEVLEELRATEERPPGRAGNNARPESGEAARRISTTTRRRLAAKAFAYTARYDAAIATWFAQRTYEGFPPTWSDAYVKVSDLRYGENPHQRAAFYARAGSPTHLLAGARQLHGKELSFNNLLDLSAARELVAEFSSPACAIVKHNNPCGCAVADGGLVAYERAFACDPESAYGGVIAINRPVDLALAQRLSRQFIEVLLAPRFDEGALQLLGEKKNLRLLELPDWPAPSHEVEGKSVIGGQLVQTRDVVSETREQMLVAGTKAPSDEQWPELLFAWKVCRHVRSNAIVISAGEATIGIGAGQMSRVDSVRIAVEKARAVQPELLAGSVLASDAYFPFADGPELAIDAGVSAIIQPGGSVRDEEVIAAADRAGVAMVLTGRRHFRH
jgi:phosphoribosylaminoimidazolecarboxamide formyltransferase/IMP cyclohydrolase